MVITDIEMVVGLVPGQGAYQPGRLRHSWGERRGSAAEVFDAVDGAAVKFFGEKVTARIFDSVPPTVDELVADAPDLLQLAIFGVSVAACRMLDEQGARPSVLLGHSLGEIAALVCAGAVALEDGAEIVCHRSVALRESADGRGLMLALACGADTAEQIMALVGDPRVVLAADNAPRQVVVSGPEPGIQTVRAVASAVGVGNTVLRAPHAFHNPALATARTELVRRIGGYRRCPLRTPVFSPILGRFYRNDDDLAQLLGAHLVTPVRFAAAVSRFYDRGARIFVELGAGSTLTDLVRECRPDVTTVLSLTGTDEDDSVAAAASYLTGGVGPTSVDQPASQLSPVVPASWTRPQVLAKVRTLYATALEYPEEVLTEDAVLEADLGIDSVKRAGLAGRVLDDFGLQMPPRAAIGTVVTFGDVVDMVCAALGGEPGGA
jgi:[acyl-carrier-protein] S-malonyltransferase